MTEVLKKIAEERLSAASVAKRIVWGGSMKKHEVGDYLQKIGDIYKIEPFQVHNEELAELGLVSTFLRAATKEMFCTPYTDAELRLEMQKRLKAFFIENHEFEVDSHRSAVFLVNNVVSYELY